MPILCQKCNFLLYRYLSMLKNQNCSYAIQQVSAIGTSIVFRKICLAKCVLIKQLEFFKRTKIHDPLVTLKSKGSPHDSN